MFQADFDDDDEMVSPDVDEFDAEMYPILAKEDKKARPNGYRPEG